MTPRTPADLREACTVCGEVVDHHADGLLAGLPVEHSAPCGTACIGGADLDEASVELFVEEARRYHCANGCPAPGCNGGGWPRRYG